MSKRMIGGDEILGRTDRVGAKSPIFSRCFARSASAVAPTISSFNTNRKSTTRFSMSLRWTSYVAFKPPRGGGAQKRKTAVFHV